MVELDKYSRLLDKKGVNFPKYLSSRHPKTKKLPVYRYKVDGEDKYLYSDDELAKLTQKEGKEIEDEVLELYEASDIDQIVVKLEKLGLGYILLLFPGVTASG